MQGPDNLQKARKQLDQLAETIIFMGIEEVVDSRTANLGMNGLECIHKYIICVYSMCMRMLIYVYMYVHTHTPYANISAYMHVRLCALTCVVRFVCLRGA